jgi:hypothetical protein
MVLYPEVYGRNFPETLNIVAHLESHLHERSFLPTPLQGNPNAMFGKNFVVRDLAD